MKKKPFENLSIRIRFILMIMLELICVSLISWIVMDVLHISDVPYIVWIILASVIAGGVLNNFLSIRYFGPVLKPVSYTHLFDPKYKNSEVLLDDFRVIIGLTAKSLGYNKVIWLKDWIDPDETNIHCITQQQPTCTCIL